MSKTMNRRTFLQSSTALSTGMWFASRAFAANEAPQNKDALNVGMIGAGAQGQVLLDSILKISMESPVHLKSICDIWEPNRERVRKTFKAYRRFGHNETDEPAFTQPVMYREIAKRASVREGYLKRLTGTGSLTAEVAEQMTVDRRQRLQDVLDEVREIKSPSPAWITFICYTPKIYLLLFPILLPAGNLKIYKLL